MLGNRFRAEAGGAVPSCRRRRLSIDRFRAIACYARNHGGTSHCESRCAAWIRPSTGWEDSRDQRCRNLPTSTSRSAPFGPSPARGTSREGKACVASGYRSSVESAGLRKLSTSHLHVEVLVSPHDARSAGLSYCLCPCAMLGARSDCQIVGDTGRFVAAAPSRARSSPPPFPARRANHPPRMPPTALAKVTAAAEESHRRADGPPNHSGRRAAATFWSRGRGRSRRGEYAGGRPSPPSAG